MDKRQQGMNLYLHNRLNGFKNQRKGAHITNRIRRNKTDINQLKSMFLKDEYGLEKLLLSLGTPAELFLEHSPLEIFKEYFILMSKVKSENLTLAIKQVRPFTDPITGKEFWGRARHPWALL